MALTNDEVREWVERTHAPLEGELLELARSVALAALWEQAEAAALTVLPDGGCASTNGVLSDIEHALRMGMLSGFLGFPGEPPRDSQTWAALSEVELLREACDVVAEVAQTLARQGSPHEPWWEAQVAWWGERASEAERVAAWCDEQMPRLEAVDSAEVTS